MQVDWFGQSSFRLTGAEATVVIDPWSPMKGLAERGITWDYPPIEGVSADVLLVTHEHQDHNAVELIGGDPAIVRSTAGRVATPIGEVLGVASEHDAEAGTARGPNSIYSFVLDGLRVCHFGDFGQSELRAAQHAALASEATDLLIVPVGDGPTIGADGAWALVEALKPRWVVPMHYKTERISFLEPADAFLARFGQVHRLETPSFETGALPVDGQSIAVVPAAP